jgi:replicative DNA helicase
MPNEIGTAPFGLSPRLPPSNVQAEQAFLGALLTNNKALDRAQFLRPEHFADPAHAHIFRRAVQRIQAGQIADPLTLKTDFENTGMLDQIGGTAYLVHLMTAMIAIINAGDYAKAIRDTWLRRQLIDVGEQIVNEALGLDPASDAVHLVDQAAEAVLALGDASPDSRGIDLAIAAQDAIRRSEAAFKNNPGETRLDTGLPSLDSLIGGLWPGQLYYLGDAQK